MDERCKSSKVDRNWVGLNFEDARLLMSIVLGWILDKQFGKLLSCNCLKSQGLYGRFGWGYGDVRYSNASAEGRR